jgi:hypothetical protein
LGDDSGMGFLGLGRVVVRRVARTRFRVFGR